MPNSPKEAAPDANAPKVISGSDQADSAARKAAAEPASEDLSAKAADLESQLAEVRAKAAGENTTRLKIGSDHVDFYHGGVSVGPDWTVVPAHTVPALMEAAAGAGVTLVQEETES
jgi:glycine/D-amino acid oxidase-like deaminating enzyme